MELRKVLNRYVYYHFITISCAVFVGLNFLSMYWISGFGGLVVVCWPLVSKFAGSNPTEAVGFLGRKKSSARLPSEGK